jgi:zeaxanthin epoxidase
MDSSFPQTLAIRDQPEGMRPKDIPYFTANPDSTITWNNWCIEAGGDKSGDAIRIDRCTGGPAQQWELSPSGNQIRLKGTGECVGLGAGAGVSPEASVELRSCAEEGTRSWQFEEAYALPAQETSSSFRHVMIAFISMAALGLLSLSAGLWRSPGTAHSLATTQGPAKNFMQDEGGVSLATPLQEVVKKPARAGNISMNAAASAGQSEALPAYPTSGVSHIFKTITADRTEKKTETGWDAPSGAITEENPLRVIIAGAGVGGLALANDLTKDPKMHVTVLERTAEFKRFGGPIQLASNALAVMKEMDEPVYDAIMKEFSFTGDKTNGIKDGIRDEWYAKFDLATPAEDRGLAYTGVIERPTLQDIYLKNLPEGVVHNGDGVVKYIANPKGHGVKAVCESGKEVEGDVIIGADGIWSSVRATMHNNPTKGDDSGCTYSGYTVFAGELAYDSFDNGEVGYKVYIGPGQYFVITDVGKGQYQWYAFLARSPGSAETTEMPDGQAKYIKNLFEGWSKDIHHILDATQEHEIQQRDLYDRPPSMRKPWVDGSAAVLGDAIHAMMPNLGQGGCQAIEDAYVIAQELKSATKREEINGKLENYRSRMLIRSASVQGLSRLASDIIISGFDTPAKIVFEGGLKFENCNYSGIVTRMLQPILPVFFTVQFNFLYDGWKNETAVDAKAAVGITLVGSLILLAGAGFTGEAGLGLGLGLESVFGTEGAVDALGIFKDFF